MVPLWSLPYKWGNWDSESWNAKLLKGRGDFDPMLSKSWVHMAWYLIIFLIQVSQLLVTTNNTPKDFFPGWISYFLIFLSVANISKGTGSEEAWKVGFQSQRFGNGQDRVWNKSKLESRRHSPQLLQGLCCLPLLRGWDGSFTGFKARHRAERIKDQGRASGLQIASEASQELSLLLCVKVRELLVPALMKSQG